ncbi:hypothetical protein JG688_00015725 [Phytophthora aleatoria]|uniref:Uncharacterized protein n=1 Tax=Phytophthora aleatoria TaxID=2496075 RepID=A0A8J5IJK2_9STRA|nr:hypothetical protein JG688_00015725 [Phytophthora aleatoria]
MCLDDPACQVSPSAGDRKWCWRVCWQQCCKSWHCSSCGALTRGPLGTIRAGHAANLAANCLHGRPLRRQTRRTRLWQVEEPLPTRPPNDSHLNARSGHCACRFNVLSL